MTNLWAIFEEIAGGREFRAGEVISHIDDFSKIRDSEGNDFLAAGTSVAVGEQALVIDGTVVQAVADLEPATPVIIFV